MLDLLYKFRLPLLQTNIETTISTTAQSSIQIVKTMPEDIGIIIGCSIDVTGTSVNGNTLITAAESDVLYLQMKQGNADFLNYVRLSNLIYVLGAGNIFTNPYRYMPLNIPATIISLDKSAYANPTGLVSAAPPTKPKCISLNLWYITPIMVNYLVDKGAIMPTPYGNLPYTQNKVK
jgi:hypothetical protein